MDSNAMLNELINRLEFNDDNLKTLDDLDSMKYPRRMVEILINHIKPNYFYDFNNKPIIIFKTIDSNKDDEIQAFMKQIWNFNETPLVFLVLPGEIQIYNGYLFDKHKGGLIKDKIVSLEDELLNVLNKWEVITGNIFSKENKLGKMFSKSKRVDQQLLLNLVTAKEMLLEYGLDKGIANNLLGRCLFIQYLVDRQALTTISRKDFINIVAQKPELYNLFSNLKGKFNGDLFNISNQEKQMVDENHLNVLKRLFSSEELKTGQISLFDLYDFSIIPVELISNIYEQFLSEKERKEDKSIYTPLFLVDFILSQTLDDILANKGTDKIKILDLSCGSGVFLVESFRKIYSSWLEKHPFSLRDEREATLHKLLENDIYGIDRNGNSIDIAILSLYIATLDYLEPRDIEVNGFVFPIMKNRTLFEADAFDLEHYYNEILSQIDFSLIVGNPPWGTPKDQELFLNYGKQKGINMRDKQIAQVFLYRCGDFANYDTEIAQVVTSKIIYNTSAKSFRQLFLGHFLIEGYLDLSISANTGVFKNALGAGSVIFYRKGSEDSIRTNYLQHLVLRHNMFLEYFAILAFEKNDIKFVPQRLFIEYDWAWKVLLHGSMYDFGFMKRLLTDEYCTLKSYLENEEIFVGAGFIRGEKDRECPLDDLEKYPIVTTKVNNNIFHDFFIEEDKLRSFREVYPDEDKFKDLGRFKAYKAPHLLVKRGINKRPVVAYTSLDCAFTNSVYGYSAPESKVDTLKMLGALLSSDIITYLVFMLSPQWGIERGEAQLVDYRKLLLPRDIGGSEQTLLARCLDEITDATKQNAQMFLKNYSDDVSVLLDRINETVNGLYFVDPSEKDFIEYATKFSIPLWRKAGSMVELVQNKEDLLDYCCVFFNVFNKLLEAEDQWLYSQVYVNKYYAAVNFTINCENTKINVVDEADDYMISKLGLLGISKLTSELVIQRDVKGFDESSFYIIKTREKKNWHPAIARIDLAEVMEAIRKTAFGEVGK